MDIPRAKIGEKYFYVNTFGVLIERTEEKSYFDYYLYKIKNYFLEIETAREFAGIYKKTLNDFWNEKEK